jgi:hypothetical protein
LRSARDLDLKRLLQLQKFNGFPSRNRRLVRIEGLKGRLRFVVAWHQSVSSVIESENVPASFEIAETRWPGEQRRTQHQTVRVVIIVVKIAQKPDRGEIVS